MRLCAFGAALLLGCTGDPSAVTLLTLNLANGAGDGFRTPDARARQAAFVADTGAEVVGLEEVDLDVARSGHADCAREVAHIDCTLSVPDFTPDGVRRCTGPAGAVVFGRSFQGDDPYDAVNGVPSGIMDADSSIDPEGTDRSPTATFGDATIVRRAASDAYVVELPTDDAQAADDPLFAELARDPPPDAARAELAAKNQTLRRGPAIEPRVVLVVRVPRAGARTLAVLVTHLESGDFASLRARQLDRVLAVAAAERAGPPARDVVILGDFNQAPDDARPRMEAAHLRDATGELLGLSGFDQIWVDASLDVVSAGQLSTSGVSDHPYAVRAVVR